MTDADKTRIEIEKEANKRFPGYLLTDERKGYIAGATVWAERLKQERNNAIQEIKKHIRYRSYDVDGNPVSVEVQKLQQYLTSLLKDKPE